MGRKVIDPTFSIMKGIAIILVVAGHTCIPFIEHLVNQIHLPVFYFVAGYFFKEEYIYKPKEYLFKRIKSLYIPYIKYGFTFLLLHNVFCALYLYPQNNTYDLFQYCKEFIKLLVLMTSNEPFMGAMWFLSSLLFVSLLFLLILFITNKVKVLKRWNNFSIGIIVLLIYIIGYQATQLEIKNPYCIWNVMQVLTIFYFGKLFSKINLDVKQYTTIIFLASGLFLLYAYYTKNTIRCQPSLMINNNFFYFPIITLVSCLLVFAISEKMSKFQMGKTVSKIGEYSFEIMALHFISFKIISFIQCIWYQYNISNMNQFPVIQQNINIWAVFYIIAGIAIPIIASRLYYKNKKKRYNAWYNSSSI